MSLCSQNKVLRKWRFNLSWGNRFSPMILTKFWQIPFYYFSKILLSTFHFITYLHIWIWLMDWKITLNRPRNNNTLIKSWKKTTLIIEEEDQIVSGFLKSLTLMISSKLHFRRMFHYMPITLMRILWIERRTQVKAMILNIWKSAINMEVL